VLTEKENDMKKCGEWPIAVCSWSLTADLDELARATAEAGLEHVHLGLAGIAGQAKGPFVAAVNGHGWTVTSTMVGFPQEDYSTLDAIKQTGGIVPDAEWEGNRELCRQAVDVTAELGVPYLSMHAGFIDETDPAYAQKFHDRIRCLADAAGGKNIMLLLETGQETAADLKAFLEELSHPAVGINFDPANMILYDKDDPIDAVRILGPWIKHVHIKDAVRTETPGEWGAEVPWGDGEVDGPAFIAALKEAGFSGALAIEREAGDTRLDDVKLAVSRLTA
jgi:sugar phosphate isomerase/epimerase